MEAGALSYRIISAGANIGNLVVPGMQNRVCAVDCYAVCCLGELPD